MPRSKHRKRPQRNNNPARITSNRPKKNKPNYLYIAASAIIAFLVIAGFVVGDCNTGGRPQNPEGVGYSDKHIKGIGQKQEIMEIDGKPTARHVDDGVKVNYNTTPPTSGDHWNRPEDCGWTSDRRRDERLVHNLEHGHIVVNYNFGTDSSADDYEIPLRQYLESYDMFNYWVVANWTDNIQLGTMSLTAWGVMDTFQGIQEERIEEFFKAYAGRLGPEFPYGLPCSMPTSNMAK